MVKPLLSNTDFGMMFLVVLVRFCFCKKFLGAIPAPERSGFVFRHVAYAQWHTVANKEIDFIDNTWYA